MKILLKIRNQNTTHIRGDFNYKLKEIADKELHFDPPRFDVSMDKRKTHLYLISVARWKRIRESYNCYLAIFIRWQTSLFGSSLRIDTSHR